MASFKEQIDASSFKVEELSNENSSLKEELILLETKFKSSEAKYISALDSSESLVDEVNSFMSDMKKYIGDDFPSLDLKNLVSISAYTRLIKKAFEKSEEALFQANERYSKVCYEFYVLLLCIFRLKLLLTLSNRKYMLKTRNIWYFLLK